MNNNRNVIVGQPLVTGGLLMGPLGLALPTMPDPFADLPAGLRGLGYVSDAGVQENNSRSTNKIKAWGGSTVRVVQTEHAYTLQFTLIETGNIDVLREVNGSENVIDLPATASTEQIIEVLVNSKTLPHRTAVVEVADGDARIRIAIPDGQITEIAEVSYTDSALIGYQCTMECFEDVRGNKAYKYINTGQKLAA